LNLKNYLLQIEKRGNKRNKEDICLHGISSIIKLIYLDIKKTCKRKTIKEIFKELKIPYQTLYSWINGYNPIPISRTYDLLEFWKKNCKKGEKECSEKWNSIYTNSKEYSQNGQRKVILPKKLNDNLAYIIGFFQGDGHLKKEKMGGFQEHSIYFYENSRIFLEKFNELFYQQFGINGNIYFQSNKTGNWYTLRCCSKPIYFFFKNVLNLRAGKKVRDIKVPDIIKEAESSIQLSFIRGFFDAEGGVGETKKNPWLDIGQASKDIPCEILLWTRNKLNENGITLSEPRRTKNQEFFRIRTSKRETIKRFFNVVSSNHQEKIDRFNAIIGR
jgi:intein/homing endonuclease